MIDESPRLYLDISRNMIVFSMTYILVLLFVKNRTYGLQWSL